MEVDDEGLVVRRGRQRRVGSVDRRRGHHVVESRRFRVTPMLGVQNDT